MGDLTTLVSQGNAVNLVSAACLTVLLYDHAITLDIEIDKMWPTRLSWAKFLFFMNRYLIEGILLFNCISASRPYQSEDLIVSPLFPHNSCVFYLRWLTISSTLSTSVVQGILVLRVWALHRHNMLAVWTAFFFYFGGIAVLTGLVIKDYVGEDVFINKDLHSLPGCYATSVPSIIAGFWIGPLIVETVLFALVASRAYFWWKDGMALPNIFVLLARDSTLYFLIVFSFLLSNFLLFQLGPPFLSSLLVTPSTTAGCILGSHMILNLRGATEKCDGGDSGDQNTQSLRWSTGTGPHTHGGQCGCETTAAPKSESFEFATRAHAGSAPSRKGKDRLAYGRNFVPLTGSEFRVLDYERGPHRERAGMESVQ